MFQKCHNDLFKVKHLRPVVDQSQHDHPKGILQLRVLIQLIEHNQRNGGLFQFNDHAHAVAIRFVSNIRYAFDPLALDQAGYLLDQSGLVHLVR